MSEIQLHCLPDAIITELSHHAATITYQNDEIIHLRGDAKSGLSVVKSGQVKMGNYGLDGKYCLTRILGPGETFGEFTLFAQLPRTHNAESLGVSEVIQLDVKTFENCCTQIPTLKDRLLSSLAVKLHETLELLDDVRRLPLPIRTAKLILALAEQTQSNPIKIRQPELADLLGVTVLSAHQALKKLSEMELIAIGYGAIEICSISVLEDWLERHSSLQKVTAHLTAEN